MMILLEICVGVLLASNVCMWVYIRTMDRNIKDFAEHTTADISQLAARQRVVEKRHMGSGYKIGGF